jgi:ABC-type Na+ efflux pump permease subunit
MLALARKDWLELLRNRQALVPVIIVPLIFVVVLPALVILAGNSSFISVPAGDLEDFVEIFPESLVPDGYSAEQTLVYAAITYMFAPFFLIIPVMIASISASSSFVGEKERRTLEGLLYTPLSNRELVLAKVLASFIPAVVFTWASFIVFTVLVNSLAWTLFDGPFFPNWTWVLMALFLVPLVAFLSVLLIVAVSQRSTTMQSAQGASVFLVLPIIGALISQASGLFFFDVTVVAIAIVLVALIDLAAFWLVVRSFQRESLLLRM